MLAHGTFRDTFPIHPGLCLVEAGSEGEALDVAEAYGLERGTRRDLRIYLVDLDLDGLCVEEVEVDVRAALDGDLFPGDSAEDIAAYVAAGVDVLRFRDADPRGRGHWTLRVLSPAALARTTVSEVLTSDDL